MADRTLTHAASLVPIGAFAGKPAMPLGRAVISVGSGKHNRIQLKSDTVSTTHALLVHTEAGWYVRDLGSRTHTILNGKVAREATLKNGDTLTIGAFVFHFVTDDRRDPVAPVQAALEITDAEFPVPIETRTIVVGRRPGSEVRLLEDSASLVHAILFEVDGVHYVRDLYSRTGTFLNGKKVHQERLSFGDDIVVGETHLKYVADTSVAYDDEATPIPVESDLAPIAIEDDNAIPLSTTARDTIDADREEPVDADAPVLPLSRRDRFESLAPSETPSVDLTTDEAIAVEQPVTPAAVESHLAPETAAPSEEDDVRTDAAFDAINASLRAARLERAIDAEADVLGIAPRAEAIAERNRARADSDAKEPAFRALLDAEEDDVKSTSTIDADAGVEVVTDEPTSPAEPLAPIDDASTVEQVVATTPDDDEADILGLAQPAGATHAVNESIISAAVNVAPAAGVEVEVEPTLELSPVEAAQAVDEPAADSVVIASATIDDALDTPVAEQTAPDDDEADILGLTPPAHASHVVAPIDDVALARTDEIGPADEVAVDLRPPDVIAVPHVEAVTPERPAFVAVDAPEPVEDFADSAEAIAPIADDVELRSALEPTAPTAIASETDRPATPAEAAELVRLEARVRSALDDPSSVTRLPPLISGEAGELSTQLGEATRRAKVIAEVLEHTEGFEAEAARQPIEFADVPEHEATRVVDSGASATASALDDAPLNEIVSLGDVAPMNEVAPLEFGDVPLDAALPPLDLDDEIAPIDETVTPLALDDAPALDETPGFTRELGTPPGADEPVAPALNAGEDALVATSSTIEAVAERAAPTLTTDDGAEPVGGSADDSVIDVVAVPAEFAPAAAEPPITIAEAMPPAVADEPPAGVAPLLIADTTPTSLGELQSAMPPAASLSIDEDVRAPVDLPVASDERVVEVADFRAPIEADAYRAGDVLGTSPLVATGPTPADFAAAREAETQAIEAQDRIDAGELVIDQAALDAADQRIDAAVEAPTFETPTFAATFETAPEPHVEPAPAALSSSIVDASAALDLPTLLEHHARPLIAADEHLGEHHDDVMPSVASIEPTPAIVADAPTIEADVLTSTIADAAAPVADETSPIVGEVEAIPSDGEPTILTETDDEIALAAGLPAHADVVEPVASINTLGDTLAEVESVPLTSHYEVVSSSNEPTSVVVVTRDAPRDDAMDDAFADALAMAAGHTFAPAILPQAAPVDAELAKHWQLDESLLEQANHQPQGPIDPLAGGMQAGGDGYLNLGGIGYIGDPETDEYEPAKPAKPAKTSKPRPRRKANTKAEAIEAAAATPEATAIDSPTDASPVAADASPIDAELETLADEPTPQRKRPATPPRPVRRAPTKRGQAAVEQSFASNVPTTHSPFAEQALPLVDAFGGTFNSAFAGDSNGAQNDAFGQASNAGVDVMLARIGTSGEAAGHVRDQPPIVPDAPSALDTHARPPEGFVRQSRPASPGLIATPFASHVPISSPTPPRPRRAAVSRRPANKLPMLVLLLAFGAALAALGVWYWPVPRTLQGQLTFENLDKLNTIQRKIVQDDVRAKLAGLAKTARQRLDDRYGDGFLDRPDAFRAVVDGAKFSNEDPNALVVRVATTVNAVVDDRVRLAALLTAAREANQGLVEARDKIVAELKALQDKQDAVSADRDVAQRRLNIVTPKAATQSDDLDALRKLDAELATLDRARQAAIQTLAAREADLRRLEADAAAIGISVRGDAMLAGTFDANEAIANFDGEVLAVSPIARLVGDRAFAGSPSALVSLASPASGVALLAGGGEVIAPIDASTTQPASNVTLDQLSKDRDAAKARLDQLLQSQTPAARQAREGFDQALNAFAGDVEAASKSLGDRPEVLAYVQSARALQKQIRDITDTLVHRQQTQLTRLGEFKRRLSEMTDSSRDQRYAGDEQLKTWGDRLAIAERRLNAAKDANASPQDIDDIQRQVSMAESTIAARKELLDDPKATLVTHELESMIQATQREMATDRQQNERLLADVQDAFQRQQPAVEKLPADQKALAQTLAGRLAQIDLARKNYTSSLGVVAGGEASAIAEARERFDAIDQQLTQRRAQVDASAQAQAAEMERRTRIARSLDDARAALIAARTTRDDAEKAYAARAGTRDAIVKRIDVARQAGQQKDVLDGQITAMKSDIATRKAQIDDLQTRLAFAVVPKEVAEPTELNTGGIDPRLGLGAAALVGLVIIFSPFLILEFRRRGRELNARSIVGGEHSTTNFPPHATAA